MRAFGPLLLLTSFATSIVSAEPVGYYRQPALFRDSILFVAEGDIWRVKDTGGAATRLTTHPGEEGHPAISPDGRTLAFTAQYEGTTEVYTMPLAGGQPTRRTFDASDKLPFVGWTPDGKLLYATGAHATLPTIQLVTLDISASDHAGAPTLVPLAQAADGDFTSDGTLFFTRQDFQGSHTKRYRGGTVQQIWRFTEGAPEAVPLTADFPGTSKRPMWFSGRIYFASDRDGTMNLWSMADSGGDLKQHTQHSGWDIATPRLHTGRIVYQLGADVRLYDVAAGIDRGVNITLDSDFDQTRERWIKEPWDYVTAYHPSPTGDRVVLTARGRVFVAPERQGRLVTIGNGTARYRDALFLPDGKSLLAFSDASGEVELWRLPANGVGMPEQLTQSGTVFRFLAAVSPDGQRVAHTDKNQRLHLLDVASREDRVIDESKTEAFDGLTWSPDGKWLAYVATADNLFQQVKLFSVEFRSITPLTTDRYDSYSPAWSPDGRWIYFLSDRNLKSIVESPWGSYQPEPFLDRKTRIYQVPLVAGTRSPFAPRDELQEVSPPEPAGAAGTAGNSAAPPAPVPKTAETNPPIRIELDGIQRRLTEVPAPPGNYSNLTVNDKALFWLATAAGERTSSLQAMPLSADKPEVKTVASDLAGYERTADGKKLLLRKGNALYVVDASPVPATLAPGAAQQGASAGGPIDLSGWMLPVRPRDEWRQMFVDAWRLERDYFYDPKLHGVDWGALRDRYLPLVDRVSSRAELSDLLGQLTSELAALHIFVRGGDRRRGGDDVVPGSLGAVLIRAPDAGGYRVEAIYESDPDEPERAAPLARPDVNVRVGDVVEAINGQATLSVPDARLLLRNTADRQVLLRIKPRDGGPSRDVIVAPLTPAAAEDLRYHAWEFSRRKRVEELGQGNIGYVHIRAMGGANFSEWARGFYPVFTRQGLIIDVRHNRGGNIDSWLIGRLLRKAWFHWSQRAGRKSLWNMQYAFRGHIAVLCDEWTASDGEAFAEGVKRLGLGKVIGTRTWGGEIWLSFDNLLIDNGIASAAQFGVFGPEGKWLIEGHGVDPDIVVDNLPHATFRGEDAQLQAAIDYLQQKIATEPVPVPEQPPFPDKAQLNQQ